MNPHRRLNITDNQITNEAFAEAARILRVEPVEIKVVFEVEASGRAFDRSGRLVRRFEPHQFPEEHWAALGFTPGSLAPWKASYKLKMSAREAMFEKALHIDVEAAYQAASWGAPQIMGFNHAAAGYASAVAMVEAFARSANEQVAAFARLVRTWKLDGAIRAHDWLGFATPYNGTGQAKKYAARLESAWKKLTGESSSVVLRAGARGSSVTTLQEQLRGLGYSVTSVDGQFGRETLAAVRAFQRDNGLKADGVVGNRTWEVLRSKAPMQQPEAQSTSLDEQALDLARAAGPAVAGGVGGRFLENLSETAEVILMTGLVLGGLGIVAYFVIPRLRRAL